MEWVKQRYGQKHYIRRSRLHRLDIRTLMMDSEPEVMLIDFAGKSFRIYGLVFGFRVLRPKITTNLLTSGGRRCSSDCAQCN